jgi:hypothetical protein
MGSRMCKGFSKKMEKPFLRGAAGRCFVAIAAPLKHEQNRCTPRECC